MVSIAGDKRKDFICTVLRSREVEYSEKYKFINKLMYKIKKERENYNKELKNIPNDLCRLSTSLGKRDAFLEVLGMLRGEND